VTDPVGISGCTVWLDADQEAYADDAKVPQWSDRSGNGNHATQATSALQPWFIENYRNGRPALDFRGGQRMNLPGGLFNVGGGTTLVAGRHRGGLTGIAYMLSSGEASGSNVRYRWYLAANADTSGTQFAMGPGPGFSADSPVVFGFGLRSEFLIYGGRADGTTATGYMNCEAPESAPAAYTGAAAGQAFIGRFFNQDEQYLQGELGELVHYNRALSDAEVLQVLDYLEDKWDVRCHGWVVGAAAIG
jgi:hypothetical protein